MPSVSGIADTICFKEMSWFVAPGFPAIASLITLFKKASSLVSFSGLPLMLANETFDFLVRKQIGYKKTLIKYFENIIGVGSIMMMPRFYCISIKS